MRQITVLLSLAAISVGLGIAPMYAMAEDAVLRIYFVPFALETYLPITKETLDQGNPIVFMNEHKFVGELLTVLQAHPAPIGLGLGPPLEWNQARLKADFGAKVGTFFASKGGAVFRERDGRTFLLTPQEMNLLDERIGYFEGVIDTYAAKRYSGK